MSSYADRLRNRAEIELELMPEDGRHLSDRTAEAIQLAMAAIANGSDLQGHDASRVGTLHGEPSTTWTPVDLAAILAGDGDLEPAPTMLARTDGEYLVYAGKVHSFNGEPEAGKGWLALKAIEERLNAGEHVAYIDFEDEATVAVDRLRALDVADDAIRERFHYVRPDEPLDDVGRAEIEGLLEHPITLAVIDGLTDALAIHGIDLRDNTEVANWMRDLPHGLRRRGVSVIVIDHVTKDSESRGRYAIGAQHKLATVDVCYHLQPKVPLGRGLEGRVLIRVTKDRPGHIRSLARNKVIAEMIAASLPGGGMDLALEAPSEDDGGAFRPTGVMRKVSRAIEDAPGLGVGAIRSAVGGKAEYVDLARELLVAEGYVEVRPEGTAQRHHSLRPFTEDEGEANED